MPPKRVLVGSASIPVLDSASNALRGYYQSRIVSNGRELTRSLWQFRPHALVLDMTLPGLVADAFLRMIREDSEYGELAILACLAGSEEESIIEVIELGADDFLSPPYSAIELTARLRGLMRSKIETAATGTIAAGTMSLDLDARRVRVGDEETALTRKEFLILEQLMRRPGKALSKDELIAASWGMPFDVNGHTLDSHISNLRRKLRNAGTRIRTVWGIGYALDEK